ncbi:MAG: DOMON domain-containing protein [Proteobacteria bacterium]|nr:DOMON domain-containing protein [Pseudomonadota bacterium]
MKKTGFILGLAAISTGLFLSYQARAQPPEPKGTDQGYSTATDKGITLKWKVEGEMLKVKVSALTTGWVAAGFDPSRGMKDANIIIGFVKDGKAVIRDDFGNGMMTHRSDIDLLGKNNVTDKTGQEENGTTEISFTIPLNSGDDKDKPLTPGNTYKVLLAAGGKDADDFSSKHKKIGSVEIKL